MNYYSGVKLPRKLPIMRYRVRYTDTGCVGAPRNEERTYRNLAELEQGIADLTRAGIASIAIDRWDSRNRTWKEIVTPCSS